MDEPIHSASATKAIPPVMGLKSWNAMKVNKEVQGYIHGNGDIP